jgi:hypothetical protein
MTELKWYSFAFPLRQHFYMTIAIPRRIYLHSRRCCCSLQQNASSIWSHIAATPRDSNAKARYPMVVAMVTMHGDVDQCQTVVQFRRFGCARRQQLIKPGRAMVALHTRACTQVGRPEFSSNSKINLSDKLLSFSFSLPRVSTTQ